jgi:MinD superfamily P-loop ATPase
MKELVVCSGKGGTGKTSVTAALAALAQAGGKGSLVLADADVDASDLHLVTAPEPLNQAPFTGGHEARIGSDRCAACGRCQDLCRFDAIKTIGRGDGYQVEPLLCEGCGVCVHFCPSEAISFPPRKTGHWFRSRTRFGPMVHARLHPGGENSGKLVTHVRGEARRWGEESGARYLIVDGPPGIGCPVTAAITGADLMLAVTEPGVSARHDLQRLLELSAHFQVRSLVCINKSDLNPDLAARITEDCRSLQVPVVGSLPFDMGMVKAQLNGRCVMDEPDSPAAEALRRIWQEIEGELL